MESSNDVETSFGGAAPLMMSDPPPPLRRASGAGSSEHGSSTSNHSLPQNSDRLSESRHSGNALSSSSFSYFYSSDFKEFIACLVFCLLCLAVMAARLPPHQRPIPYQLLDDNQRVLNLSLNEEFNGDTVSDTLGSIIGAVLPLVIQIGLAKFCKFRGDAHLTVCCYMVAFGITLLMTYFVKNYVGYLRPVFYELCQPSADYTECTDEDADGGT